ncbi:MAG: sensor histidine kinase [Rectinemataceae bacterium]
MTDVVFSGSGAAAFSDFDHDTLSRLFSSFLDHIPAGIIIKDETLRYIYVNRYLKDLYGESNWEGRRAADLYPGDPALPDIDEEDRRALQDGPIEVFVTIPDAGKLPRRFRITKFPIVLADGERVLGYIMNDITELSKVQKELSAAVADREILLKEVYHRVKNNLATVAALIRLGAEGVRDEKALDAFEDSCRRIESLALLHEELYGSESLSDLDFGKYLRSVTERLFASSMPSSRINLKIETERVSLPIASAVPLALIANELVTNALKYAFPSHASGTVSVSIAREADTDTIALRVADDGVGLPVGLEPGEAQSLGFVLVHHLAEQIGASAGHRSRPGTEFWIRFPAPKEASRAEKA